MTYTKQTYTISIHPGLEPPVRIPVTQMDNSRELYLVIDGATLTYNDTLTLYATTPDGVLHTQTVGIYTTPNTVNLYVGEDLCAIPGTTHCMLQVGNIGTASFYLDIEGMPEQNAEPILPPAGTLSITENGTYDVAEYAAASVSIPGPSGTISITEDGTYDVTDYDTAQVETVGDITGDYMRAGLLVDFDMGDVEYCPYVSIGGVNYSVFQGCQFIQSIKADNLSQANYEYFAYMPGLTRFESASLYSIAGYAFRNSGLETLILRADTMCALVNSDALVGTPIAAGRGNIYVKDSLVQQYRQNTNWAIYSAQILPISDLPTT